MIYSQLSLKEPSPLHFQPTAQLSPCLSLSPAVCLHCCPKFMYCSLPLCVHLYCPSCLWRLRLLFLSGSAGKEYACSEGDLSSIPGLGRSPGEGKGYPLQYPDLENSMDCIVPGVEKSRTRLSNFHFHFTFTQNPTQASAPPGSFPLLLQCYSMLVTGLS